MISIDEFFIILDELSDAIQKCKDLLLEKADPNSSRSQQDITDELDNIVQNALSKFLKSGWPD